MVVVVVVGVVCQKEGRYDVLMSCDVRTGQGGYLWDMREEGEVGEGVSSSPCTWEDTALSATDGCRQVISSTKNASVMGKCTFRWEGRA